MMQLVKSHANDGDVLKVLGRSKAPMSAYDILDALREKGTGIKAPTQVYRALERLMKVGEVHRIAALNAFVRCSCVHQGNAPGFMVCIDCGTVKEFDATADALPKNSPKGFSLAPASFEISGTCQNCQKAGGK